VGAGPGAFDHPFPPELVIDNDIGPRRAVRDYLPMPPERRRQGRPLGLGCIRLHHREGQGHQTVTEGTTGLDGSLRALHLLI